MISQTHASLVYDTLFAADRQQRVHPQMVDNYERDEDGLTWRFKLREGLGWHDGTAVTARDCVASIRRWAVRSVIGKMMMERAERLDALDDNAFILKLKGPFGLVPETLGKGPYCFVMLAKTGSAGRATSSSRGCAWSISRRETTRNAAGPSRRSSGVS